MRGQPATATSRPASRRPARADCYVGRGMRERHVVQVRQRVIAVVVVLGLALGRHPLVVALACDMQHLPLGRKAPPRHHRADGDVDLARALAAAEHEHGRPVGSKPKPRRASALGERGVEFGPHRDAGLDELARKVDAPCRRSAPHTSSAARLSARFATPGSAFGSMQHDLQVRGSRPARAQHRDGGDDGHARVAAARR